MEQKLASWLCLSALLARTQHVGFTARPRALVVVVVGANLIYHDTPRRRCISHELLSSLLTHIPVICIKIACAQLQPAGGWPSRGRFQLLRPYFARELHRRRPPFLN
jgi:hypothetical protein